MIYNKQNYDELLKGFPHEPNESTAACIKTGIENGRMEYFCEMINYLEENKIPYEQIKMSYSIKVKDMTIRPDMKVRFDAGKKKLYQYNYSKIIKRINNE